MNVDKTSVSRFRLIAAAILAGGLGARLAFSATAFGTNDVTYFGVFARVIRSVGAIRIYHFNFDPPYNHPPLVGWILTGVNWLTDHGLSFPFALRLFPILADLGAAVLVMWIVRRRSGDRSALIAGAIVAFSPVLILVSGVHGNLDTVFCALTLLSLVLMVEKRWPVWAGVVGAVAVGVKLIPLVVIPVIAVSLGTRRTFLRYSLGFLVASAAIWVPPLLRESHGVTTYVLGYRGQYGHWGLQELATLAGVKKSTLISAQGVMGWGASALAMLAGIWFLVRTKYRAPYAAAGLALTVLLLLLPGFGSQYLSWPAAFVFFIGAGLAAAYSLAAGVFLFVVYAGWSHGLPLNNIHVDLHQSTWGITLGMISWAVLGLIVAYAFMRARRIRDADVLAY